MGLWDSMKQAASSVFNAAKQVVALAVTVVAEVGKRVVKTVSSGWERIKQWAMGTLNIKSEQRNQPTKHTYEFSNQTNSEYSLTDEQKLNIFSDAVSNFSNKMQQQMEETTSDSYEEYMRLMLVRKLLNDIGKKVKKTNSVNCLSVGDIEVCRLSNLILDNNLSGNDITRLDEIINERFGKNLLATGTEQVMFLWSEQDQEVIEKKRANDLNIHEAEYDIEYLDELRVVTGLSQHQQKRLNECKTQVAELNKSNSELVKQHENLWYMVGICEGLLREYENPDPNPLKQADVEEAAKVIVEWHKTGDLNLSAEQLERTKIFANMHIYRAEQRLKAEKLNS